MSHKKNRPQIVASGTGSAAKEKGGGHARSKQARESASPQVSGRWLLGAIAVTVSVAALCMWGVLCALFWQGSWQLLYSPSSIVARTPASTGMAFDPVEFAATDAGVARLKGWWIPAEPGAHLGRITVLYLHGQNGNMGNMVDALAQLHTVGVNVLAFDYRGYGQSQFARPSEAHWRQDSEWALQYLTGTRHIDASTIVLDGTALGANLAIEVAAAHPELAGVIVDAPLEDPMNALFNDARARLVPVHLLVRDRYNLSEAAGALHIPVLWFEWSEKMGPGGLPEEPEAYKNASAKKMLVWMKASGDADKQYDDALSRWLDGLPNHSLAQNPIH